MNKYMEANRAWWKAITPLHLGPGEIYDLPALRAGGSSLLCFERELLGDVSGKRLLHAQCHIGIDSISLARLGAEVVGVDFCEEAMGAARQLAGECNVPVRLLCGNIVDLPDYLDATFDIVYAGYGVLCWIPDLVRWFRVLTERLVPGGILVVIDGHPICDSLETDEANGPYFARGYFPGPEPECYTTDGDYHNWEEKFNMPTYEWIHPMSEILNAAIGAGLVIETVREYAEGFHTRYAGMVEGEDGLFRLPPEQAKFPLTFALRARKS